MARPAILLGALLAAATAGCAKRDPSVSWATPTSASGGGGGGGPLKATLALEGRIGAANGHIQIPKGGQPGTTSIGRPTLDEVGANTAWAPSGDLRLDWGRHRVHVGGTWWFLHGSETLRQNLTTHDDTYLAGTDMTSSSDLVEAWLAYDHWFDLSSCVSLAPGVGIYGHRIAYDVSGGGTSSDRSFDAFSPMFEVEGLWRTSGSMHVTGNLRLVVDDLLGLSSPTSVVEGDVRWHWDVSRCANVYMAVGATHISHHDEQPVPNDVLLNVVPWFGFGGEIRF